MFHMQPETLLDDEKAYDGNDNDSEIVFQILHKE